MPALIKPLLDRQQQRFLQYKSACKGLAGVDTNTEVSTPAQHVLSSGDHQGT